VRASFVTRRRTFAFWRQAGERVTVTRTHFAFRIDMWDASGENHRRVRHWR
jgi:hypothetical protein